MKVTEISIPLNNQVSLKADLQIPSDATALVIFSHGSGSSRFSSRNRYVAQLLNENGIATLLTDLLTEEEDRTYTNRFNIALLTERLLTVTNKVTQFPDLKNIYIGYFGASTGAASALKAAVRIPKVVKAIVSRGGRPDLAAEDLPKVKTPTLFVVGSLDKDVLALNRDAYSKLNCEKNFQIVEGATHLFEEPGKLDVVADLAANWFNKFLVPNHTLNS
jgi:putative phosphoribosyl transferase